MPGVDFAILCQSAAESQPNMISLLNGPIDTIKTVKIPFQVPLTLAVRFLWSLRELGREHRGEIFFQDEDGNQLLKMDFRTTPNRPPDAIKGWRVGSNLIIGFALEIKKPGIFSFEILIDDKEVKSLPLRVKKAK